VMTWLLLLALPWQGAVAATMLHCATDHVHAAGVHGEVNVPNHAHRHSHPAAHAHGESDSQAAAGVDTPSHDAGGQCSVCASCCASSVIASSPLTVAVALPPRVFPSPPIEWPVDRVPDRLERPPRQRLA